MAEVTTCITPKIDISLDKNTKGFNYSIKAKEFDAGTKEQIDCAFELLDYAKNKAESLYGAASVSVNGGEK
ncbi:hypothetical protein D3C87_1627100 [compost metagenome]